MLSTFAICLGLTILLETSFALFAGVRGGKNFLIIVLIQVITNPLVVLSFLWIGSHFHWPGYAYELPIETLVVIVEALYYRKYLKCIKRPFSFSLAANYFSYSFGIILHSFGIW